MKKSTAHRGSWIDSGARGWVILALLACGCDAAPKPSVATPTPEDTPIVVAVDPAVEEEDRRRESADALGRVTAAVYQEARAAIAGSGGSARYLGQGYGNFMELSVSFSSNSAGFDDFEYTLPCESANPPAICAMIRAFDPGKVAQMAELVRQLGVEVDVEFRVDGKADPVWKNPRKPIVYAGNCGEGVCSTQSGPITLGEGLAVNSNEVLACLRALCTQAQAGLRSPSVQVKLRGLISGRGSDEAARRAEMALRLELPSDLRHIIWNTFLRQVGHK